MLDSDIVAGGLLILQMSEVLLVINKDNVSVRFRVERDFFRNVAGGIDFPHANLTGGNKHIKGLQNICRYHILAKLKVVKGKNDYVRGQ